MFIPPHKNKVQIVSRLVNVPERKDTVSASEKKRCFFSFKEEMLLQFQTERAFVCVCVCFLHPFNTKNGGFTQIKATLNTVF